jgi:phage repressor protein C with HTH and peptisase S24 domain
MLVRLVNEGVSTTAELAERADGSSNYVQNTLGALVKAGRIRRVANGYYEPITSPRVSDSARAEYSTDLVAVPLASVTASAGPGSEPFTEEVAGYVAYNRAQLRRDTGTSPEQLVVLIATGNSMQPVIYPGDRMLVSIQAGGQVIDACVYVWQNSYDGLMVKRARWSDGYLLIKGDNEPEPSARIVPSDENPPWRVIGRVLRVEKPL